MDSSTAGVVMMATAEPMLLPLVLAWHAGARPAAAARLRERMAAPG